MKNSLHFYFNKKLFQFAFKIQSEVRLRILKQVSQSFIFKDVDLNEINKIITFSTERLANNCLIPIVLAMPELFLFIFLLILLGVKQPETMIFMSMLIMVSAILFNNFFKKKYVNWGKNYNNSSKLLLLSTTNVINGLEELKILNKENIFFSISQKHSENFAFFASKYRLYQKLPRQFFEIIILSSLVSLFLASNFFLNSSVNKLIDLALFGIIGIRIIPIVGSILSTVNEIKFAKSSIEEIFKILNNRKVKKEVYENNFKKKSNLEFSNIKLSNVKIKKIQNIFKEGIYLNVNKGDFIGIYGKSGVGKTTLLRTLTGMNINHTSGQISLNKERLKNNNFKNLSSIVYRIKQNPLFFEGSIFENITLGDHFNNITNNKVNRALRLAQCDFAIKKK